MGWLTKIFKGSSHKLWEGQYHGRREEDTARQRPPSTNGDALSDFDAEEIDRAIALSLAEEEERAIAQEDQKSVSEKDDKSVAGEDERSLAGEDERSLVEEDDRCIAEDDELSIAGESETSTEEDHRESPEENDQKGKKVIEDNSYLEEDEQLAKAIQESLNVGTPPSPPPPPPRYDYGGFPSPYQFFYPSGYRICAGCKTEIGHGRFLSCMGGTWHPECFVCHACRQPISDYEFSMSDNQPYHKSCYKELHHPKCDVCKNFIPTNAAGLIEYRAHPFWQQKYCPSHEHDGTPRCCSCERMEQVDAKYLILGDGRKLCLECLDSSIMDTGECQPLYIEIQEFYEGLLMKVEQQVPLLLVERQALNEAMEGEKQGHHHMPETRGLCLSEEQTVSTILRRPRIGGDRIVDMFTRPYKLVRKCEVTAILILYGLPRLLTGSILAHEMMHAWLRLKGFNNLSPEVEEGICQVLAHMWLDSEIISGSGSTATSTSSSSSASPSSSSSASSSSSTSSKKGNRSQFEKKLGEFFKHQIESDTSAAYGDGFREGNKSVLRYGLRRTLDHMQLTGCFP